MGALETAFGLVCSSLLTLISIQLNSLIKRMTKLSDSLEDHGNRILTLEVKHDVLASNVRSKNHA